MTAVNDADGPLICLRSLYKKCYDKKVWPDTNKSLRAALDQTVKEIKSNTTFVAWVNEKPKSRKVECSEQIILQFIKLGYVQRSGKNITWNLKKVEAIITGASHISNERPVDQTVSPPNDSNNKDTSKSLVVDNSTNLLMIESMLKDFVEEDGVQKIIALKCIGAPDSLYLLQIALPDQTILFDCIKLSPEVVCQKLMRIFVDDKIIKLVHDVHSDSVALFKIGCDSTLKGFLDTQLVVEFRTGDPLSPFDRMLREFNVPNNDVKSWSKISANNSDALGRRPLQQHIVQYASVFVSLLHQASKTIFDEFCDSIVQLQRVTDARIEAAIRNQGAREMAFDTSNAYRVASLEFLKEFRPDSILAPQRLEVSNETSLLIDLLPPDLAADIDDTDQLFEIALDKGRPAFAWIANERVFLGSEDRLVDANDIQAVVQKLGGFGPDNRAGLERQLHRISAIRNRQSDIIGLTIRVGRYITGNATMIADLLLGDDSSSILFLGEPGSGKTTVIREVTRLIADHVNTCIVDTSNEIAGDGDIPHPCIGLARRMMVKSLNDQANVMVECIQNHTPTVMIIDEIGRSAEVEAARTCKERGVRLIASAHGDFRKLIKNPKLRGLVGGVETVTLGDEQAKLEAKQSNGKMSKLKAQRGGAPVFDIIIELHRGQHHEWRIIFDTADAVDRVLDKMTYTVQRRTRNPESGAFQFHMEQG